MTTSRCAKGSERRRILSMTSTVCSKVASRRGVKDDDSVRDLLAAAGIGLDFSKYVGELCQCLNALIDLVPDESLNGCLEGLRRFFSKLGENRKEWNSRQRAKAWIATMTAISLHRDEIVSKVLPRTVEIIEGRWLKILEILAEKNIHVLPGGTVVVLARTRYVIEELDRRGPPVRFHAVPLQPSPQPDAARANALRNDRDGDSDRKNGQIIDFMGVV